MRIVNPAFGLEEGGDNMSNAVELSTDWFKDGSPSFRTRSRMPVSCSKV